MVYIEAFWGSMFFKIAKRHQIRSFAIQKRVWVYQSVIRRGKKTSVFENLK